MYQVPVERSAPFTITSSAEVPGVREAASYSVRVGGAPFRRNRSASLPTCWFT